MGILSTAVDLDEARKVRAFFWVAVDCGHHCLLSFENPDAIAEHLEHDSVIFPFFENLDLERLCTRIIVPPHAFQILGGLAILQWRQGFLSRTVLCCRR